jgi:hypothetical protein
MAVAMTFASLQTDVAAYLERGVVLTDPIPLAQIPSCINLAERRIARDIKLLGMKQPLTSNLSTGVAVLSKPVNWLRTASISIGTGTSGNVRVYLRPRSYEYARTCFPNDATTAQPRFYSDWDFDHWFISPTPDSSYAFEAICYMQPMLLDSGNQTNWLTNHAPNLLLAASCLELAVFCKADLSPWQQMYAEAMQAEGGDDLKKIVDSTSTRQGA